MFVPETSSFIYLKISNPVSAMQRRHIIGQARGKMY